MHRSSRYRSGSFLALGLLTALAVTAVPASGAVAAPAAAQIEQVGPQADTTPPQVHAVKRQLQKGRIAFRGTDDDSGLASVEYSLDSGQTWETYSHDDLVQRSKIAVATELLPLDISFYAKDVAGNISATETATVVPGTITVKHDPKIYLSQKKRMMRVGSVIVLKHTRAKGNDSVHSTQWFSGGTAINPQPNDTYTLRPSDVGHRIWVEETIQIKGRTSVTRATPKSIKVLAGKIEVSKKAKIKKRHKKNKVRVGKKLTVTKGQYQAAITKKMPTVVAYWQDPPVIDGTIKYRWFAGKDKIKGKKGKKKHYKIRKADKGSKLRVKVKVKKKGYKKTTYKTTKTVKVKKRK